MFSPSSSADRTVLQASRLRLRWPSALGPATARAHHQPYDRPSQSTPQLTQHSAHRRDL
jgi:hypothetical protein